MKWFIIGYGSFGLVFANILADKGFKVVVWGRRQERVKEIAKTRRDLKRLGNDFVLHENVELTTEFGKIEDADYIVNALPSHAIEEVFNEFKNILMQVRERKILSLTKGFTASEKLPHEVIKQFFEKYASLSGPTIARELARKLPASAVVSSPYIEIAREFQSFISSHYFRLYVNEDIKSVELGGALKNVIAIAGGMVDGLKLGINAKGALLTRGIAEMIKLAMVLGGKPETLWGLAGYGDLITTAFSQYSRNRTLGERLAHGIPLNRILKELEMVAEGVRTSFIALKLARKFNVELPITEAVVRILKNESTPEKVLRELINRPLKHEFYYLHKEFREN